MALHYLLFLLQKNGSMDFLKFVKSLKPEKIESLIVQRFDKRFEDNPKMHKLSILLKWSADLLPE